MTTEKMWKSPNEWLWWKAGVLKKSDLIDILRLLSKHIDANLIEEYLQVEMDYDGYCNGRSA